MAAKIDSRDSRVFVMVGDGECDEGQVWEAAMSASHYRLDNLTAIVDRNGIQNDRFTSEVMNLEPLPDKWRSFGWHVIQIDGHSFPEVLNALDEARSVKGQAHSHHRGHRQGQGRELYGEQPRLSRQSSQRRSVRAGVQGAGGLAADCRR